MNKHFKLLPLICVFVLLFIQIPLGHATESTIAAFIAEPTTYNQLYTLYPNGATSADRSATCETIYTTGEGYLTEISVPISWKGHQTNTPLDANITVAIYNVTSQAANSKPDVILASSTLQVHFPTGYNVTLLTSWAWYDFPFNGTYYMNSSQWYALVWTISYVGYGDSNNNICPGTVGVGGYSGYSGNYYNSQWNTMYAAGDNPFIITGSSISGGEPTPTVPPAEPGSANYIDYLIDQMIDFFIPLIIMLIPAFLLGYVCRMGKWGYIIGLAIGSGLGYTFIPGFPVWLIFLVSLGIIGFAYSEVKRGN